MNDATTIDFDRMSSHAVAHPYPLIFATISGAHLYGFPSPDSDFDLRGMHLLPLRTVLGLDEGDQTVERDTIDDGLEIDLVTHEAEKFLRLMLKRNGYVLEQVYSPLIVHTTAEHEELKSIGKDCITRHHAYHYLGFAGSQWKLFSKESPPRIKPLLYTYRVLLTGIHLMKTGEIESNLTILNREHRLSYLDELISRKMKGGEKDVLESEDLSFHRSEHARLTAELESAHARSRLPEMPSAKPALNDLLLRLRMPR